MTIPVSDDYILRKLKGQPPLIAREVSSLVKCNVDYARVRLDRLVAAGKLARKMERRRVGANNNVKTRIADVYVYSLPPERGIAVEGVA